MTKTLRSLLSYIALAIIVLVAVVTTQVVTAQTTTTTGIKPPLHSFNSRNKSDGGSPQAGLVQGSDGNLYGTTYEGGANDKGMIFRVAPDGSNFASLYSFSGKDGQNPNSTLIDGGDGKSFYGTTNSGGSSKRDGTIFKFTLDEKSNLKEFKSLYSFGTTDGDDVTTYSDGNFPNGLVRDNEGKFFYGTTNGGFGTYYRITADGTFETLYEFGSSNTAGFGPYGKLVQDKNGNFYGTNNNGGKLRGGTLYSVPPRYLSPKELPNVLYSFDAGNDVSQGYAPSAGVIQDTEGNLYGTTNRGGEKYPPDGTIFKYSLKDGTLKTLHKFSGSDGTILETSLLLASDGKLYGTTVQGGMGKPGAGVVYSISTDGKNFDAPYTYNFSVGDGGPSAPQSELIQGQDGSLYGTSKGGGPYNDGTVYKLDGKLLGLVALKGFTTFDIKGNAVNVEFHVKDTNGNSLKNANGNNITTVQGIASKLGFDELAWVQWRSGGVNIKFYQISDDKFSCDGLISEAICAGIRGSYVPANVPYKESDRQSILDRSNAILKNSNGKEPQAVVAKLSGGVYDLKPATPMAFPNGLPPADYQLFDPVVQQSGNAKTGVFDILFYKNIDQYVYFAAVPVDKPAFDQYPFFDPLSDIETANKTARLAFGDSAVISEKAQASIEKFQLRLVGVRDTQEAPYKQAIPLPNGIQIGSDYTVYYGQTCFNKIYDGTVNPVSTTFNASGCWTHYP